MRALTSLMAGTWSKRRASVLALLAVAALVPVAVLLTLVPQRGENLVQAAVVNLDVPITDTSTPVAVGKLLTENLVGQPGDFDWTLTDAATAAAGLADGTFLAVVTVPSDFSKTTTTLATGTPVQAQLGVQTSGAHGYLAGSIATALSRSLPAGVSAQLTAGYVQGTLDALGKLGQGVGQASTGAATIANGTSEAAAGAAKIGAGTAELGTGLGTLSQILDALPPGARDLGELTAAGSKASGDLALRLLGESAVSEDLVLRQDLLAAEIAALRDEIADDPTLPPAEIEKQLAALQAQAAGISDDLAPQRDRLVGDAVDAGVVAAGAGVIAELSAPVADGLGGLATAVGQASAGAGLLASADEQLSGGLAQLAQGGTQLSQGLGKVEAGIPQYTTGQQQQIASVVATPITVQTESVAGPSTAWAASLAALAPVALWLGALVVFLFVAPFSRAALTTPASAWRVARSGAGVAVLLALAQVVPLAVLLAVTGATGDRVVVTIGFLAGVAVVFALIHQALVAAFGRGGLVVSLLALGVQLIAAGTLAPHAATVDGPLSLLPLSLALQGMQAVVGGSLHGVLAAAIGLAIWAVVAVLATLVAVTRARHRAVTEVLSLAA